MKHLPADFYVRTTTPELCAMVQEHLFSFGSSWYLNGQNILACWNVYRSDTYIRHNGDVISYGEFKYRNGDIPEISIADLFILLPEPKKKTLEIKNVPWKIELGPELVSIGCCSFKKEELKETLAKIWNLSPEERKSYLFYDFPTKTTDGSKTISFYIGRNGLDVWINQKFEHSVSWRAVEELIRGLNQL